MLKTGGLSFSIVLFFTSTAMAQQRESLPALPRLSDAGPVQVLTALRAGGYILACRHAKTDRNAARTGPFDLSDRRTQRNLSTTGEAQARSLGRALADLNIPVEAVYSSPMARTMETAELAFGRATVDDDLYSGRRLSPRKLKERFNRAPLRGNAVLMTHQGVLRPALGYKTPGEGDCVVVRPGSTGPEVVANVTVGEWQAMAATNRRQP